MKITIHILVFLSLSTIRKISVQRVKTGHVFTPILNKDISPSQINSNLIQSTQFNSKYDCINSCKKIANCVLILFKLNQCNLYNAINDAYFISIVLNQDAYLFKRIVNDYTSINAHLKYYWPFNNDLTDVISNRKLEIGANAFFTTDRLNKNLSAIKLSKGFLQGPADTYFTGDFTVSAWVKVIEFFPLERFFEFSNPSCNSVVRTLFTDETTNNSFTRIWSSGTSTDRIYSNIPFKLNRWQHFVITLNSNMSEMYIDNRLVGYGPSKPPPMINYTNVFIGKDCGTSPIYSSFELDDLKIFDSYLNPQEILKNMNFFF